MINVLVISGGGFQGSTLIECLKQSDHVLIHMADCFQENINKYECDVFHQVPLISSETDFLNAVIQIVLLHKIHVLFPSTDHELKMLSKNKDKIECHGARIAISDLPLTKILLNKLETYQFLKKNGFPLLDFVHPINIETNFPVIGKPVTGFGSKGIVIIRNKEEYQTVKETITIKDYIWLPFLDDFDEFSVDFAISFDKKISTLTVRKRVRTAGGFSVINRSENNFKISQQVKRLAKLLVHSGGYGIFNVQIMHYGRNILHVSDINPRVGTSSVFTLGVGVNLPVFMCKPFMEFEDERKISIKSLKSTIMIRNLTQKWIDVLPKGTIKGLIFDLDDTLIDQKKWIFDKLSIVYESYAQQLPEKTNFELAAYRIVEEGKRSTLFDELKKYFQLSESLRTEMIKTYRKAVPPSIYVYRDVRMNIDKLKRLGYKIGLLTDNPVQSQKQKLKKLDFIHYFDSILFSMEYKKEKPDKTLFEKIAKNLCLEKHHLAMVGDNLYRDCFGAINAGFSVAFFIHRKGGFFNFNVGHFKQLAQEKSKKIKKIQNLNELYYTIDDR